MLFNVTNLVSGILIALLMYAALCDVATRTIPNSLSLSVVSCGLVLQVTSAHLLPAALIGLSVLAVATALWLRGWLGGGDVKLLAAGIVAVPLGSAWQCLVVVTAAGGVLALLYLALSAIVPRPAPGRPTSLLRRVLKAEAWRIHRRGPLPYATAVAAGVLFTLFPS